MSKTLLDYENRKRAWNSTWAKKNSQIFQLANKRKSPIFCVNQVYINSPSNSKVTAWIWDQKNENIAELEKWERS